MTSVISDPSWGGGEPIRLSHCHEELLGGLDEVCVTLAPWLSMPHAAEPGT